MMSPRVGAVTPASSAKREGEGERAQCSSLLLLGGRSPFPASLLPHPRQFRTTAVPFLAPTRGGAHRKGGGKMGGLPTAEGEAGSGAADVSAEGTLVWLRRPNGTWWPSIVISPLDVPDGCAPPPRCPAVPIMLLGRRDGTTYVDWCNLERCKRVKPFRCGELDLEQRITNAQARTASRRRHNGRYARIEDAVLQALEIERARALHIHSPSPKKKRKTPNDSEDDAPPRGSRRMRDLSDLSSAAPTPDLSNALNSHLPSVVNQAKRSKHTHATAKRKHVDQPCPASRKKDRSRPLSELCNGDAWNGFKSNGQTADAHLSASSSSSSGTSTLDKTCSPCRGASKTDRPKLTESSSMNVILSHEFPHFDDFVKPDPLAAASILEPDHWPASQTCASPKYQNWRHLKQTTECSKDDLSSQCDRENFKVKTIGSVHQEGRNRTGHKHHKTKEVKQKAPVNGAVLLEKKPDKVTVNKSSEPCGNVQLAVFRADLEVLQQHSERNHDLGESSGTISNITNCENGSVSPLVFELALQMLPPPDLERCHAVKRIKTLQLNSTLYDVELSAQGVSNNGRRVPLVSLMSKWNHKPVVGYPISVEVSDDVFHCPLSTMDDNQPARSVVDGLLKKGRAGGLPSSNACRAKPKSRKKTSGKEADKLWQPHTKKATSSPRKMRRLSSFASSQRDGDEAKSVVGKVSGPTITCIPLRVVFSRIKEALSYPTK